MEPLTLQRFCTLSLLLFTITVYAASDTSVIISKTKSNLFHMEGTGVLKIKKPGSLTKLSLSIQSTDASLIYQATNEFTRYRLCLPNQGSPLETDTQPFALSDFNNGDLNASFLDWSDQKLLTNPTQLKRGRTYYLLQSRNNAKTGYSKVITWIDAETYGIIEADMFDQQEQEVKEFEPKSFKKIAGHWEVQTVEMRNLKQSSSSTIELNPK